MTTRCEDCDRPIPENEGKTGRPFRRCAACRGGTTPLDPEAAIATARRAHAIDENRARAEAEAWRDAYEALLADAYDGLTLSASCRRLEWE